MKEEKDKWKELVRAKLYDFEADTRPEEWSRIAERLDASEQSANQLKELTGDQRHTAKLRFYRNYYRAAAVAAILIIVGGLGLYYGGRRQPDAERNPIAVNADRHTDSRQDEKKSEETATTVAENAPVGVVAQNTETKRVLKKKSDDDSGDLRQPRYTCISIPEPSLPKINPKMVVSESPSLRRQPNISKLISDASPMVKRRRWGFGMGGGGYAAGSGIGSESGYFKALSDEYILRKQTLKLLSDQQPSPADNLRNITRYAIGEKPMGEVKHTTPLSVGLGVSYYLNDRWALQSGLAYTLLRSEWTYSPVEQDKTQWKQQLHYIGVPLSISYSIAEWKRIRLYATAGGMFEWNVAGSMKKQDYIDGLLTVESGKIRMNEPLWSLNARAGASYPVWRFVQIYAEAGASYYFDNHSNIETIRSYKPFNVSLQGGIRLGF